MHSATGSRAYGRTFTPPQCSNKGFGTSKPAKSAKPSSKGTAKTVQQAADQALEAAAKSAPKVRPINPREAAKGKVDYVQIKDWAKGEAADLGELQVVPDSFTAAFSAGNEAGMQQPFFAQLGRHAAYLESQGATKVALGPGNKPFVPFEQWQYTLPRYRQYMADLAEVHQALEQALQLALVLPQPATAAVDSSSSSSSSSSDDGSSSITGGVADDATAALSCFSSACGFWRSESARADLAALSRLAAVQQQEEDRLPSNQQPAVQELQASQTAVAYGKYLQQLGRTASAAAAAPAVSGAGTSSSKASLQAAEDGDQEARAAALKLLAHAYALHTQQQCLGTRIGAAATDALDLMSAAAAAAAGGTRPTAVYMDYPAHVEEPLQQLIRATDEAGRLLGAEGRRAVMDELPKALTKATLVLAPLATP